MDFGALEERIGYRFKAPQILKEALSHKSFASESRSELCNERLEFLGDSILSAVVAHKLYLDFPDEDEGNLSKRKSQLVSRPNLAAWAAELDLGSFLYLGVGEEASGGRSRQSLLANALEALIGAIYLDGGYGPVERFILECLERRASVLPRDYKSRLQELLQKQRKAVPAYELLGTSGPEHEKVFTVEVMDGSNVLGRGNGKTKKEAEQAAARDALEAMGLGPSEDFR